MKKIISFSFVVLVSMSIASAKNFIKVENSIPATDTIVGYFDFNQLRDSPYDSWFSPEYEYYSVDTTTLNLLNDKLLDGITITVVMGTWCSDSQREVPRFVKILEYLNFDLDNVTAIGVNRKKQAPNTEVKDLKINYVPTFIFYKDHNEIGRIVESPEQSLEIDMVKIIMGD